MCGLWHSPRTLISCNLKRVRVVKTLRGHTRYLITWESPTAISLSLFPVEILFSLYSLNVFGSVIKFVHKKPNWNFISCCLKFNFMMGQRLMIDWGEWKARKRSIITEDHPKYQNICWTFYLSRVFKALCNIDWLKSLFLRSLDISAADKEKI